MKYRGKEKCRILKQIRAEIAKNNDIEWVVDECTHKGDCRGTCPKCEEEVRELEKALAERKSLGKKVAVVGIAAGIALSAPGCVKKPAQPYGAANAAQTEQSEQTRQTVLTGDVAVPESADEQTEEAIAGMMLPLDSVPELPPDGELPPEDIESEEEILMGEPVEYVPEATKLEPDEPVLMGKIPAPPESEKPAEEIPETTTAETGSGDKN